MFSTFDFDKPVEIDDVKDDDDDIEVDSKGRKKAKHYDFEIEGKISDDEEESETVEKIDVESANQIIHDYTTNERPAKEQYYDEDDEGNDIEMDEFTEKFTTEAIKDKYDEEHQPDEEESSSEEEFMPTFGAPKPAVNDTETLHEDDEDLDTEKQIDAAKQEQLFQEIQRQKQDEIILAKQQKYGLFWPHFDSPFLSTQSQLSKLGNEKIVLPGEQEGGDDEGESAYEKWFWSMRGEILRECKRRKRDVLRSLRKKSNHR
ncbi:60S ribosome subunit biogenesis protein NOP8 [Candida viswanathii]|uniref:60S ribosome subunit biogenesis protein NOP8 n=1 Tax=Candida viswanathii TaxID=5486 RepID=A0A367XUT6_9ASCO|nr:60S ribosome subunit biogenesis protein NOP8 [Candida viswanathii]